jgi:hypothetical protein
LRSTIRYCGLEKLKEARLSARRAPIVHRDSDYAEGNHRLQYGSTLSLVPTRIFKLAAGQDSRQRMRKESASARHTEASPLN